jgi:SAM-dependent methyltransferase
MEPTADTRLAAPAPPAAADPAVARLLRALLDEGGYAEIVALLRGSSLTRPFAEPFSGHRIRAAIAGLPPLPRLLVRLFMLGAAVEPAEAERALGDETLARLLAGGVLERSGGRLRSRLVVVCWLNRCFAVSPPLWLRGWEPGETHVPIGPDSYWTAQFVAQRGPVERMLDLCTGSGLLATLADARSAIGVELDPAVAAAARFNVLLNGLEERVEIREGDLYAPVAEEAPFDLIVATPPCLPAPAGVSLPPAGDGGADGEVVLRRVLEGVERLLAPGGRALVQAQGFGDEEEPALAAWLRETLAGSALHATVLVGDGQSLEAAGVTVRELWQAAGASEQEAFDVWARFCESSPVTSHHTFLVRLARAGGSGGAGGAAGALDVPGADRAAGSVAVHRLPGS